MPRRARRHAEGGIYHVTARGNDRHLVFLDVPDRQVFVAKLAQVSRRFAWSCRSYCLMGNHYHLLVAAGPSSLADGMRLLNGTYATHFNRRHERSGHLWQDRFRSEAIRHDGHVLATMRYIAMNPVKARLCARPEDWVWSGHRGLVGARADVVAREEALRPFHPDPSVAQRLYSELVGVDAADTSTRAVNEPALWRPTMVEIVRRHGRDLGVAVANVDYAYSVREIAAAAGVHHTSVLAWLRRGRVERERGQSPVGLVEPERGQSPFGVAWDAAGGRAA